MMTQLYAAASSDDQIDLLVIALQALQDPGSDSHDIPAIDRGRAIIRKWLADNSVSTGQEAVRVEALEEAENDRRFEAAKALIDRPAPAALAQPEPEGVTLAHDAYVAFVQICKGNSDDAGTYEADEELVRRALKRLSDLDPGRPPIAAELDNNSTH